MKIIYIGGEPGTGKTSLMKKIKEKLELTELYEEVKFVPYYRKGNLYLLGKYPEGEVFGGTDKMSMACQAPVIEWLATLPKDSIILAEGDRLFTRTFLEDCNDKYDLSIVGLRVGKDTLNERYKERGSAQNEKWLSGRATKVANVFSNFDLMDSIEICQNSNEKEQSTIIEKVLSLVGE